MKTLLSLIAVLLLAFNLRAEDIKLTSRTDKEVKVKVTLNKDIDYLLLLRQSKQKLAELADTMQYLPKSDNMPANSTSVINEDINVVYYGRSKDEVPITGFKPDNSYIIDLYTINKTKEKNKEKYLYSHILSSDTIVTLALEPTLTTSKVMFTSVTDTSMMVIFKKGNGENRILLMKKGHAPKVPADGTIIQKDLGGNKWQNLGDSTFVAYNSLGTKSSQCDLYGLAKGTDYYFYVIEYNGSGKSANFFNRNGIMNPKDQSTLILPPIVHTPEDVTSKGFKLSWDPIPDVLAYMYEVATDPEFKDILNDYDQHDVGTETSEYVDLSKEQGSEFYVRVRVYMKTTKSNWTETIKVKIR
ncbi:MAG: hypothetical protein WCR42_01290 [bacterium]